MRQNIEVIQNCILKSPLPLVWLWHVVIKHTDFHGELFILQAGLRCPFFLR